MLAIRVLLVLSCLTTNANTEPQTVDENCKFQNGEVETDNTSTSVTNFQANKCNSPWEYSCNGSCVCASPKSNYLHCDVSKNLTILHGFCVTYNEEEGFTEFGKCLYTFRFIQSDDVEKHRHVTLPKNKSELNEFMCGPFNRKGTLCGKCKDGFYPLAYSFDMKCVECPNGKSNWWKFILAAFLPLTVFYFIVLLFKINVTSSNLQGFVYCSQGIVMPAMMRILIIILGSNTAMVTAARYAGALYGIWNLDFLRFMDLGICLGTSPLQTLALDLIVAAYPFLLMLITYILIELHDRNFRPLVIIWKPFGKIFTFFHQKWEIRTSLIDAFATFFLLSNVKFLSVTYDIYAPILISKLDSNGHFNYGWRLYYDATIPVLGDEHVHYVYLATAILLFLILLPMIVFFLYPFSFFQKFLNLFPFRWYILHTFMDAFQGCYKDGTQPGTRDCRWFAAIFLLTRIAVMIIGALTQSEMYYPFATMILVIMAVLIITFQPFKANVSHLSDINAIFILIMALWYTTMIGQQESDERTPWFLMPLYAMAFITGLLPLLYISAIIAHWMYSHRKFGSVLIRRLHAQRQGYDTLQ